MKDIKKKLGKFFKKNWPLIFFVAVVVIFFWKFFFKGLVPIPSDFIVGVYFPWLDYKWAGYLAGVPVKNPLLADVPSLIYPLRIYAIEQIKQGIMPLWNPLQFGGYPLLATFQAGVFHPFNFLYFLLDNVTAWSIQVMLQPLLVLFITYLFLRDLKLSKLASTVGSVVYAFSGFNIMWLEYNLHVLVASFIPLILFLVNRFVKEKKLLWGVLISFSFALQVFSGYPQVTIYTAMLAIAWTLFLSNGLKHASQAIKNVLAVGVFGLLGAALSAIQLLPGYELLGMSQRLSESVSGGIEVAYLPFKQLITILAPDFFGNPSTYNYWGPGNYTNTAIYSGVVALILASLSILTKKKPVKFFLWLFVVVLILALPTPLSFYISDINLLGLGAATTTRLFVLTNFSVAVLASYGIDLLGSKNLPKSAIRSAYVPIIIVGGVFLGLLADYVWLGKLSSNLPDGRVMESFLTQMSNFKVSLRNLVVPGILILSSSLLVYFSFLFKHGRGVFRFILLIMVTFELVRFGWKYIPFSEREFVFPRTPILEFLKSAEMPFRFSEGDVLPISMWLPYGIESPSGYDAVYPADWAEFISVANSNDPEAGPTGRYGNFQNPSSRLFNLANVKYLLAVKRGELGVPFEDGEVSHFYNLDKFNIVFEDKSVAILENSEVLPRAIIVTEWETKDRSEMFRTMLDENFSLDKKILLEEEFDLFQQSVSAEYSIDYQEYLPNKSRITVNSNSDGFLFVSDSWYPGWKVFVDGEEEKIYRADYVFRAVPVEKGTHNVEFIYEPESFRMGKWLSSATLVFLSGILVYDKKKNSRRTS